MQGFASEQGATKMTTAPGATKMTTAPDTTTQKSPIHGDAVVRPADDRVSAQTAAGGARVAVGCVGQSVSGPGTILSLILPCCYGPCFCGPPYCTVGGACGDAEEPALAVYDSEGDGPIWKPISAWCLCAPVCLVSYLPLALVGCFRPDAINVGPCCLCVGVYGSLGRRHPPCGGEGNLERPGEAGNWIGDHED